MKKTGLCGVFLESMMFYLKRLVNKSRIAGRVDRKRIRTGDEGLETVWQKPGIQPCPFNLPCLKLRIAVLFGRQPVSLNYS